MARYGFTQYGIPLYGEVEGNRLYYNSNISAWSFDYGTVYIRWNSILVDPADAPFTITHWKLVRSFVGAPDTPYSGTVLDSDVIGNFRLQYTDSTVSLSSTDAREVTYILWGFNGRDWIECGNTTAVLISQTTTQELFTRWLPAAWLNNTLGVGDEIGEPEETNPLTLTISGYSFAYDKLRSDASLLENYSDAAIIPRKLLKNKIEDLGFTFEPSLGDIYHRSLYKSGYLINATKGTTRGVEAYTIALTHWGNEISVGENLLLDYNDSSFEESTGRWHTSGGVLDNHLYATSLQELGYTVTPPVTSLVTDPEYPPRMLGFGSLSGHTNTPTTLSLPAPTADKVLYGIPIKPDTRYLFFGMAKCLTDKLGTVKAKIIWYDRTGTLISSTAYGATVSLTQSDSEFSSPSTLGRNGTVSPSNAAYASIEMVLTPNNNQTHFLFDLLQFCEAYSKTIYVSKNLPSYEYQDPRLIQILPEGNLQNLIPNPSFTSGVSGWESFNSTLVQDFHTPAETKVYNTVVAKLKTKTDGRVALISEWIPIQSSATYTFSAYISSPESKNIIARIEFSTKQSEEDQTKVLSDSFGRYYDPIPYYVDSNVLVTDDTAARISVTAIAPVQSEYSGTPLAKVSLIINESSVGDELYVSSAMLTKTTTPFDYFQGDGGVTPANPNINTFFDTNECYWEKRLHLNFISNPTFEATTLNKWTPAAGTALTTQTTVTPPFGNRYGQVVGTGGGQISTVVTLPYGASVGGEDIVVSAYVRNVAGTYSIQTTNQTQAQFVVDEANKDEWIRISVNRVLGVGETSFTVTIGLSDAGSGSKTFYITGVQAEYGRIATPFVNIFTSGTKSAINPSSPTDSIYYAYAPMVNSGISTYAARYDIKKNRLNNTLSAVVPLGSTWKISTTKSDVGYSEIENTLLTSPSFETNLLGWSGENSTIKRILSRGTVYDEVLTHGSSHAHVTAAASGDFSILSEFVPISIATGYYVSAAVLPDNPDAYGTYSIKIKFYNSSYGFIKERSFSQYVGRTDRWTYLDVISPGSKTIGISSAIRTSNTITVETPANHGFQVGEDVNVLFSSPANNVFATSSGSYVITAVTPNTFSFVKAGNDIPYTVVGGRVVFINTGVSYAKVEVECSPDTPNPGVTFGVDRVIFRE